VLNHNPLGAAAPVDSFEDVCDVYPRSRLLRIAPQAPVFAREDVNLIYAGLKVSLAPTADLTGRG